MYLNIFKLKSAIVGRKKHSLIINTFLKKLWRDCPQYYSIFIF